MKTNNQAAVFQRCLDAQYLMALSATRNRRGELRPTLAASRAMRRAEKVEIDDRLGFGSLGEKFTEKATV